VKGDDDAVIMMSMVNEVNFLHCVHQPFGTVLCRQRVLALHPYYVPNNYKPLETCSNRVVKVYTIKTCTSRACPFVRGHNIPGRGRAMVGKYIEKYILV
jgi:hypothetical protein